MIELFTGTGIAHSILLFAVVIASGLYLGRFKIKGVSIGSTWILFVAILISHFGLRADPTVLSFMKDFGLILFVFSIGLQVGPGFFHSFKTGGVKLNLLAFFGIILTLLVTAVIHLISGESLQTMVGVMSGAVTNTPGLGAAQQTLSDTMISGGASKDAAADAVASLASAYAVAYPLGVIGVILMIMLFRSIFKVDLAKEKAELDRLDNDVEVARRMHVEVENPAVVGRKLQEIMKDLGDSFVVSRLMRDGVISIPVSNTVLEKGDRLLIVTSQQHVDTVRLIFGEEIPMHQKDWAKLNESLVTRRLAITKSSLTGKRIKDLRLRSIYGVTITRVVRSGVELVASPNLILQMGDSIQVVGVASELDQVASMVGNKPEDLFHPNLVPIFAGIALGVIFGSIPFHFPGIPQPVKIGLAGGPLVIAILLGHFGPKWGITTYTTQSANMMIREIGISFFLAAVGLGAGETFVSSIVNGGYWWILYGALITMVPIFLMGLVARLAFKVNFYQLCGLVAGSMTNPAALAYAQGEYGTGYTSVNYATVYPLSMFMRVLGAQILMLFAL
jgi:putative transport protein